MIRIAVILLLFCTSQAQISYEGYSLIQIDVSAEQKAQFNEITSVYKCIPWTQDPISMLIDPAEKTAIFDALTAKGISFNVSLENIQTLIDEQNQDINDVPNDIDLDKWNTFPVIENFLTNLPTKTGSCRIVTKVIGESYENRSIYMVKIFKPRPRRRKSHCRRRKRKHRKAFIVDGGIHGREWISPAFVLHFIYQLIYNPNNDPDIYFLTKKFDWYIIPVVNPDGYAYTFTGDRFWRKNRSPSENNCTGVDINRNFDHMWDPSNGGSSDPCDYEVYAGPNALSEVESTVLAGVLNHHKFCAYLTFHSFGQYWLYPWAYTNELPNDWEDLDRCANASTAAMKSKYDTKYQFGSYANHISTVGGLSLDYANAVSRIKFSYQINLRDEGEYGFLLPADQILPTCNETLCGVIELAKYIKYVKHY